MENEKFGYLFRRIGNASKKSIDHYMRGCGLTMSQSMVLGFLTFAPESKRTQKNIESHFGLQHPTVSGILKRLEKNGFIECSVNEVDRRLKDIHITQKARDLNEHIKEIEDHMEERFVKGLDESEVSTLKKLLKHIVENLDN